MSVSGNIAADFDQPYYSIVNIASAFLSQNTHVHVLLMAFYRVWCPVITSGRWQNKL